MENSKKSSMQRTGNRNDDMRKEETSSESRNRNRNRANEDFDEGNPKTNYSTDNTNAPGNIQRTSGSTEEGDEDYDDEKHGKDFDDYNKEYEDEVSEDEDLLKSQRNRQDR
jgi:hypothetical protein